MHHGDVPKPSGMPAVNTDSYYRITLFPNERNIDISSAGPGTHLDASSDAGQGDPSARNLAAGSLETLRLPEMSLQFPVFVAWLVPTRRWPRDGRASGHGGYKTQLSVSRFLLGLLWA